MDAFIEILKTIFLAFVEGITEWLPISSTGHMILVDEFLHLKVTDDFKEMFFVVIQLGAIFAVVLMYFHKLNPFSKKKTPKQKENTWTLWFKVLLACLPAAVLGLLFDDLLNKYLYNFPTVAITLLVYGILFIVIENRNKNRQPKITKLAELDYKTALMIGAFQVLSLIPGTSRSGATILGAILLGCSRYAAAEFSFFLAIPVMFGASGLKLGKFFLDTGFKMSGLEVAILLTGMLVAFIVSVFAIKFLMKYIKKRDFKGFGYYRIVLGLLVLGYFVYTLVAAK